MFLYFKGQVEGGYMQGYGLYTLEELQYSPQGHLLTKGPGMYKLPGFGDIPEEFNVALLRGAPNAKAVFSSKVIALPNNYLLIILWSMSTIFCRLLENRHCF